METKQPSIEPRIFLRQDVGWAKRSVPTISSIDSLGVVGTALSAPLPTLRLLVEDASGVDDDGLAGHGLGAAHRDHHVCAVVLVGWPFQERGGCGALDLF